MKKIFTPNYLSALLILTLGCHFQHVSAQNTILKGQIKQSDGSPLNNSTVLLLQYNSTTKSHYIVDSTITDATGNYKFEGTQEYSILAKPNKKSENELPTYYGNTILSEKATHVVMNFEGVATADFTTIPKALSNSGVASIGGTISLGKSLGGASKLTVFLADKNKNPIAVTSTNTSGGFQFENLAMGDYSVLVDFSGVDNTNADVINLSVLNPQKKTLHFRIEDGSLNCLESSYTSIKTAAANKTNVYALNLSSLQHDVAEESLIIAPDGTKMLSTQIGDFPNLETLLIDINLINFLPADIGKLSKLTTLSSNLNKLSDVPAELGNLKNLKTLNLGKNNFNKVPDVITNITSLEVLNFENNPIPTLPPTISNLKNLKELNLASCFDILVLPPQIGDLTNLETLNLSNCVKLKSLPKELKNLKNLKVLDITGTKLSAKDFQKAVPGCEVRMTQK